MSKKQSHYIQLDLIILLLALMTVSILAIYNAQQLGQYPDVNFALQQFIYYLLGIGIAVVIQFIDLDQLYKSSLYLFIIGVLGVVLLYKIGRASCRERVFVYVVFVVLIRE